MSSEEEATAANVLSQMSQIQQISCETIEATVINVGHHCDVETTASQGKFASLTISLPRSHLVIPLTVCPIVLMMFLQRICHWINFIK